MNKVRPNHRANGGNGRATPALMARAGKPREDGNGGLRPASRPWRIRPLLANERQSQTEREHRKLHEELFAATQIQRRLCAPRQGRRGRFEFSSEVFPVRYIAGDFSNVLDLGTAVGLVVGDISGKGLAAGFWFTYLVGMMRLHARAFAEPAAAMAALNRAVCQMQAEPPLTALFFGRLDPGTGHLVYCNAGLPPPLVVRSAGRIDSLVEGGPLIGAVPEASFGAGRVRLDPGDSLIGYSDGIIECRNDRGEEFGPHRLLAAARNAGEVPANATLFSILAAVQNFAANNPREDDMTLLVVRRSKE